MIFGRAPCAKAMEGISPANAVKSLFIQKMLLFGDKDTIK